MTDTSLGEVPTDGGNLMLLGKRFFRYFCVGIMLTVATLEFFHAPVDPAQAGLAGSVVGIGLGLLAKKMAFLT